MIAIAPTLSIPPCSRVRVFGSCRPALYKVNGTHPLSVAAEVVELVEDGAVLGEASEALLAELQEVDDGGERGDETGLGGLIDVLLEAERYARHLK